MLPDLVVASKSKTHRVIYLIAAWLIVTAVSGIAQIFFQWPWLSSGVQGDPGMALSTAASFIGVAVALFLITMLISQKVVAIMDVLEAIDQETTRLAHKIDTLIEQLASDKARAELDAELLIELARVSERMKALGADPVTLIPIP